MGGGHLERLHRVKCVHIQVGTFAPGKIFSVNPILDILRGATECGHVIMILNVLLLH